MARIPEEAWEKIKALRLQGKFAKARKLLWEQESLEPQSVSLLKEGYHLFSMLGDWERAFTYATKLSLLEPDKGEHAVKKGRACMYLNNRLEAREWLVKGIESLTGKPLKEVQETVEKSMMTVLNVNPDLTVRSRYHIAGGKNNLGFFHHQIEGREQEYITKILEKRKKREAYFYREILERFPRLKDFCPGFVLSKRLGGVNLLTLEKIKTEKIPEDEEQLFLMGFFQGMARVEYSEELQSFLKVPKTPLRLGEGRSQGLVKYFESIDREETNRTLFRQIEEKLNRKKYPASVKLIFRTWERMVLGLEISKSIHREKDFSLIHGDLGPHNLLYCGQSRGLKVIDWNSYRLGPKAYDMAYYSIKTRRTFPDGEKELSSMDQFLLYYAMSAIAFIGSGKKKFRETYLSDAYTWLRKGKKSAGKIIRERGIQGKTLQFTLLLGAAMALVKALIALEGIKGGVLWVRRKSPIN